jgi:uncharacterized NAD-dependent epimerase/dehydratase family protein
MASAIQTLGEQKGVCELPRPYLLFLGDTSDPAFAKTAFGLRDWTPELCVGQFACPGARISLGLPELTPAQARARGARAAVIGVANIGGVLQDNWISPLCEALAAGLDVISGMHGRLADVPELQAHADRHGRRLLDVRIPPRNIPVATGRKRTGRRLLTVGTDCALGKKYTALTLTREFKQRGVNAEFRATGQTGILIAGSGIPIDAVISDFVAGAAEMLSPDATTDHWDIIEGQGSIFHPAYAGVSLGLLHGSQPDVIVLCHAVGRDRILSLPEYATPGLREGLELTLTLARRTNPNVRAAGIALNTASLGRTEGLAAMERLELSLGLPVADPLRPGAELDRLVTACLV